MYSGSKNKCAHNGISPRRKKNIFRNEHQRMNTVQRINEENRRHQFTFLSNLFLARIETLDNLLVIIEWSALDYMALHPLSPSTLLRKRKKQKKLLKLQPPFHVLLTSQYPIYLFFFFERNFLPRIRIEIARPIKKREGMDLLCCKLWPCMSPN